MQHDPFEIQRFKTEIDIRQYAAGLGYAIDKADDSVIRRNGEKLIVVRKPDRKYRFWNPHDDKDRGTIVDFIASRKHVTIREAIDELRLWTGSPVAALPVVAKELTAVVKDRAAVQENLAGMRVATEHHYLQAERGISPITLACWRFRGRILIDRHRNAGFPHFDKQGVCGAELKNYKFTGFTPQGSKGLWLSRISPNDRTVVICETAIDDLSHFQLKDDGRTRYASTAGAMSPAQHELICAQISQMPPGSAIVGAGDNDAAGRKHNAAIYRAFQQAGRGLTYREDVPTRKDFNDDWRAVWRGELVPA